MIPNIYYFFHDYFPFPSIFTYFSFSIMSFSLTVSPIYILALYSYPLPYHMPYLSLWLKISFHVMYFGHCFLILNTSQILPTFLPTFSAISFSLSLENKQANKILLINQNFLKREKDIINQIFITYHFPLHCKRLFSFFVLKKWLIA